MQRVDGRMDTLFYATLTTADVAFGGSAVCVFSLNAINQVCLLARFLFSFHLDRLLAMLEKIANSSHNEMFPLITAVTRTAYCLWRCTLERSLHTNEGFLFLEFVTWKEMSGWSERSEKRRIVCVS